MASKDDELSKEFITAREGKLIIDDIAPWRQGKSEIVKKFYQASGGGPPRRSEIEFEADNCHRAPPHEFACEYTPECDALDVEHLRTGRKYRLSASYAAQAGLHPNAITEKALAAPIPTISTRKEERVHITHQGSPLCGFTNERPVDWPKGHFHVSLEAFRQGSPINCKMCAASVKVSEL